MVILRFITIVVFAFAATTKIQAQTQAPLPLPAALNKEIQEQKGVVFLFLSTECPLCKQYGFRLEQMNLSLAADSLLLVTVFPNNESKKDLNEFIQQFGYTGAVLMDAKHKFTNFLKAEVTPEVFLLNNQGQLFYRGAIDNLAIVPSRMRTIATEHYLNNAVASFQNAQPVLPDSTKPVGCYIHQN